MRRWRVPVVVLVVVLLVGALLPALASIVPDDRTVPRIAVVARGDNPIDALSSAPIAGATGGIVVLTVPAELTQPAADALKAFAPDVVILAGGTAALSEQVRAQVTALGSWEVRRVSGTDRYLTAAALATVLAEYGLDGLAVSDAVPAHDQTVYVQDTGDDETNGTALLAAIESLPDDPGEGWRIALDPGRFDLGTRQLVVPSEVELIGAGRYATWIGSARGAANPTRTAAVVTGEPGGSLTLRSLTVENTFEEAGSVVAVFSDGWIELHDVMVGQNTEKPDTGKPNSYGLVSPGGFEMYDSEVLGFGGPTGTAVLVPAGYGGRIESSTLHTQGNDQGAGIVIGAGATGNVTVKNSHIRGFAQAQGFIHGGAGRLEFLWTEFRQDGQDGTVTAGWVTIASSLREKTISVSGTGTVACIYDFTSAGAAAPSC